MSYGKLKLDHYHNLGGINTKVSPYQNDETEFRDLSNVDFRNPGALTQRDGITQLVPLSISGPIRAMANLYGQKLISATQVYSPSLLTSWAGTRGYFVSGATQVVFQDGLANTTQNYSVRQYGPWQFYANGSDFKKFNGSTFTVNWFTSPLNIDPSTGGSIVFDSQNFGLPPGPDISAITFLSLGSSIATGVFSYRLSWVDRLGYIGPPGAAATLSLPNFLGQIIMGSTFSGGQPTGWTVPASYGIGFTTLVNYGGVTVSDFFNVALWRTNGVTSDYFFRSFERVHPFSFSTDAAVIDTATNAASFAVLGVTPITTSLSFTLAPKFIEVFNNSLFLAGFTQSPNSISYSDLGEPEGIQPGSVQPVSNNIGDQITGLIFFGGRLIIGKENSLFSITGDEPVNYTLRQITDKYGMLNNAAVVYDNLLLVLDKKGIVEYNGANVTIISYPIEDIFKSMNINAAKSTAIAMHSKRLNQIWFGIPINGSTVNNVTVVYDYLLRKWTKYEGYNPSYFISSDIGFNSPVETIGNYTGMINYMSPSFVNDNGSAFTVLIKGRYDNTDKFSTTMQYRQLYLDSPIASGGTLEISLFPNYQDGASLVAYLPRDQYQERLDFGLPATSMSVQIKKFDTVERFVLYGYAMASRFQRGTVAFSQE